MSSSRVDRLHEDGFVVLRGEIDPVPISAEIDQVFSDAFGGRAAVRTVAQGTGTVTFEYVPMMCEQTPESLGLIDRCSVIAAELLGRAVLPGRAKATRYHGDTAWHRDSERDIPTIGFVAYLEPLGATTGALRVVAGSHARRSMRLPGADSNDPAVPGEAVETLPGDVIVFDEHLIHGTTGGGERRQWRVDFVIDPHDADEEASVRAWFDPGIADEQHDPGYDTERYPSYGSHWQTRDRPWTNRLRELGVY